METLGAEIHNKSDRRLLTDGEGGQRQLIQATASVTNATA
ncbi:hypothetical protein MY1884_005253 [Beauveria asiatica]